MGFQPMRAIAISRELHHPTGPSSPLAASANDQSEIG
jgi:hypothetical protein